VIFLNSFIKQTNEEYAVSVDFSNTLEDSETISSFTISAIDNSGNSSNSIIDSSINDDDSVEFIVTGGNNETIYKISIVVTSSLGYIYEEDVYMEVINF
jgi:hypothetical protein